MQMCLYSWNYQPKQYVMSVRKYPLFREEEKGSYSGWKPIAAFSVVLDSCFQYLNNLQALVLEGPGIQKLLSCLLQSRGFAVSEPFSVKGGWDTIAAPVPVCKTRWLLLLVGILIWAVKVLLIVGFGPKAFVSEIHALIIRGHIYANTGNSKKFFFVSFSVLTEENGKGR